MSCGLDGSQYASFIPPIFRFGFKDRPSKPLANVFGTVPLEVVIIMLPKELDSELLQKPSLCCQTSFKTLADSLKCSAGGASGGFPVELIMLADQSPPFSVVSKKI